MTTPEGYYSYSENVRHDTENFWNGDLLEQALRGQADKLMQAKLDDKFIPKLWCLSGASKQ